MNEEPKVDAVIANPQDSESQPVTAEHEPDYKVKFSESSKEALRLLEETKAKDAEIERLKGLTDGASYSSNSDSLYPGFENLGEEEQKNLLDYTNSIKKSTLDQVYKDPAIAFAKHNYNEQKFNDAFEKATVNFPDLKEFKDEFKSKHYNKDNVPTNIDSIVNDLAQIYLYPKAKEIGAREALEQANRIEVERANGGDKTPQASRSLDDWNRMAQDNPAQFAKQSKQFNEELASGKLK